MTLATIVSTGLDSSIEELPTEIGKEPDKLRGRKRKVTFAPAANDDRSSSSVCQICSVGVVKVFLYLSNSTRRRDSCSADGGGKFSENEGTCRAVSVGGQNLWVDKNDPF